MLENSLEQKTVDEHLKFLSSAIFGEIRTIDYLILKKASLFYKVTYHKNSDFKNNYLDILDIEYNYLLELSSYYGYGYPFMQFSRYFWKKMKEANLKIFNVRLAEATYINTLKAKYTIEETVIRIMNFSELSKNEKGKYLAVSKHMLSKYGEEYLEIYCADKSACILGDIENWLNDTQNVAKIQIAIAGMIKQIEPWKETHADLESFILTENKYISTQFAPSESEEKRFIEPFYSNRFKNKYTANLYLSMLKGTMYSDAKYWEQEAIANVIIKDVVKMHKLGLITAQRLREHMGYEFGIYKSNHIENLRISYWILSYTNEGNEPDEYVLNSLKIAAIRWKLKQKEKARNIIKPFLATIANMDLSKNEYNSIEHMLEILYLTKFYSEFEMLFLRYNDNVKENNENEVDDTNLSDLMRECNGLPWPFDKDELDEDEDELFEKGISKTIVKMYKNIQKIK